MKKDTSDRRSGRDLGTISGVVTSSRGRGLRGIDVSIVGADEDVVATTVTGIGGTFTVEDLRPGTYRVSATDPDGDFAPGWAGGASFTEAKKLKLNRDKNRSGVGVQLLAMPGIDVEIVDHGGTAAVCARVTERGTGVAAGGRVHVINKLISAELPLTQGQTTITLHASPQSGRLPRKVTVDYSGDEHTASGSFSTKLA